MRIQTSFQICHGHGIENLKTELQFIFDNHPSCEIEFIEEQLLLHHLKTHKSTLENSLAFLKTIEPELTIGLKNSTSR